MVLITLTATKGVVSSKGSMITTSKTITFQLKAHVIPICHIAAICSTECMVLITSRCATVYHSP